jgi:ribonuclease BN (tRNA processing enzyme)
VPLEVRCGPLFVTLINGVTGDPAALVRLRHRRGTLLFDVGDCGALSRRRLHAVTDLFLSHAHFDHVAGFPTLLRSRLSAALPPLRVFGPPGTSDHVGGFLAGIRWDRIGDDGPAFEVTEINGRQATRTLLKAGQTPTAGESTQLDGTILETPDYRVRVLELDHRIPALSYRLELSEQHNVDTAALAQRGLEAGPWLGTLKANVSRGLRAAQVELPDGTRVPSGGLADSLLRRTLGPSIVYATDFADHAANRRQLEAFAEGAQLLICEATFREEDVALARDTQHLTTKACGEIARASAVERLLPFHVSKRYEGGLASVYREIADACGAVELIRQPVYNADPVFDSMRP